MLARNLNGFRFLVQRSDAVAQLTRLGFLGLGLGGLLLAHQGADFLRRAVALGLESFDLGEQFAPVFIQFEQPVNVGFVPCPACGKTLAHKIGLVADQFDVEHGWIIEIQRPAARWKPDSYNGASHLGTV